MILQLCLVFDLLDAPMSFTVAYRCDDDLICF